MTSYGNYDFLWMQRHSYGCQNSLSNGSIDFLLVPVTPIPITIECKFWLINGSYDFLLVDMTLLW